ncbi:hypothetical protein AcW1_007638 [Taiwanofungus camphoratus]|nr:hypothetical protein AcV5_007646 [Antrodia cinnamomea]KAI0953412.1 hypothetical protein AcW1_007638 [Antrodia cinnamomea]
MSRFASKYWRSVTEPASYAQRSEPPPWRPAPEQSHDYGLCNEATEREYQDAVEFCSRNPPDLPKLLPSKVIERIGVEGCKAWGLEWPPSPRFAGSIQNGSERDRPGVVSVTTHEKCQDVCILSDLPLLAGLYDTCGKEGVYYEVLIKKMKGIIAIGTACRPYPGWRFPGWERLSAGLHLDDFRKFFEDPEGGRDYTDLLTSISSGDTIGCGYHFATAALFFTHNGVRLPNAFRGIYLPRERYDVFAAVGVEGENELEVNFGGDWFRWKEGNEPGWRVEGHVGRLDGGTRGADDELPSYEEARRGSLGRH